MRDTLFMIGAVICMAIVFTLFIMGWVWAEGRHQEKMEYNCREVLGCEKYKCLMEEDTRQNPYQKNEIKYLNCLLEQKK